jgi:hypothetical protein
LRVLREIERLDPERDCQRIVWLSGAWDFPWDSQRALELALLRTFAVPRESELLVATGEFTERTQKRYDDTVILISTIGNHGYDSDLGRRAIRRMNQIHARHPIANDAFVYVLSTFVLEPTRWIDRWGWRPLSEHEKLANFHFWHQIGRRMAIRDLPDSLEELERVSLAYERERFVFHPANRALADATRELFLSWWLPRALRPAARPFVHAVMDPPLRHALGLPDPSPRQEALLAAALRGRAALLGRLPPRRRAFELPPTRTYGSGVAVERVGADRPAPER